MEKGFVSRWGKTPTWFALSEDRPLFAFAGLWTPWRSVRGPKKSAPVEGNHELFGFLTTEANAVAAPCALPPTGCLLRFQFWARPGGQVRLRRPRRHARPAV